MAAGLGRMLRCDWVRDDSGWSGSRLSRLMQVARENQHEGSQNYKGVLRTLIKQHISLSSQTASAQPDSQPSPSNCHLGSSSKYSLRTIYLPSFHPITNLTK